MSELLRALIARLPQNAIHGDYIDERRLGDMVDRQYGDPNDPTAIAQMRAKASGKPPVAMVNEIQLDR